MLCQLIAYDEDGSVVATLSYCVAKDEEGRVVGLVDFAGYEQSGGSLRDIWKVSNAVGSATWPEWLGGSAHEFKVILAGPAGNKRIVKLVHKTSGHVRDREQIEAAIEARKDEARREGRAADLRDLVGGPDRPLRLDDEGKTRPRTPRGSRPLLPFVSGRGRSQPPGQE
jgi:hypothetical protein